MGNTGTVSVVRQVGPPRRSLVGGAAAALLLAIAGSPALAQSNYPTRPIRLVVPFAAGGGTDVAARLVAAEMTKTVRQQIVVENKLGASGTIGVDTVAKSRPDGYTLGIAGVGPTAIIPYMDQKTPYDPVRDLAFVGRVNIVEWLLCARPGLPFSDLPGLMEDAKKNPGKYTYGSVGAASPNHIVHEEIARRGGTKMLHVPFNGEAPIITAMMTDQVDIGYITVATAAEFIKSGKLRVLASGGPQRSERFPDLPTVAEAMKWPDYSAFAWTTLVASKETPTDIMGQLNTALNGALTDPGVKDRMTALGLNPVPSTAAETQAFVESEIKRYGELVKLNNITRQ